MINNNMDRRKFLKHTIQLVTISGMTGLFYCGGNDVAWSANNQYLKKAYFYQKLGNNKVKCLLCPNYCITFPGQSGKCKVRVNINGEFYSNVYTRAAILHLDNIEKTPLFHFKPGTKMLSLGTSGCNLTCKYCQNWQYSQASPDGVKSFDLTVSEVINKAKASGCKAISFFYTEPIVFYEYMYDIALAAKKAGLKTVMETAAYINPEPLSHLCDVIDAFGIGLKGFNEKYYRSVIGGSLEPVKNSLKVIKSKNKHFEIVTLIVPTLNDNMVDVKNMVGWIKTNLGKDVPLHFTRFVPEYKLQNLPPTPVTALNTAWETAKGQGLEYVYIDNLPGHEAQNTICPKCKKTLVTRVGFKVIDNKLKTNKCPYCKTNIRIIL